MGKSLGEYNIKQSSSQDTKNIKWTQRNSVDTEKSRTKKKKPRKTSSTNIIYAQNTKDKSLIQKNFKIEDTPNTEKLKNNKIKKYQNSALSNCKIEPGFRRPGR